MVLSVGGPEQIDKAISTQTLRHFAHLDTDAPPFLTDTLMTPEGLKYPYVSSVLCLSIDSLVPFPRLLEAQGALQERPCPAGARAAPIRDR